MDSQISDKILNKCIQMYRTRLESLQQTIRNIYKLAQQDESLNLLNLPELQKNRIERVKEIITQCINTERQRLLIRALTYIQKSQQHTLEDRNQQNIKVLSEQLDKSAISLKNYQRLLIEKSLQLQKKKHQCDSLNKKLIVFQNQVDELHIQKQIRENSEQKHLLCSNCSQFQFKLEQLSQKIVIISQEKQKMIQENQQLESYKKNAEQEIKKLEKSSSSLLQENQRLKYHLMENNLRKNQAQRAQQVNQLKQQLKILEQTLCSVQNNYLIVKQNIINKCRKLISQLKRELLNMKQQICGKFQYFIMEQMNSFKSQIKGQILLLLEQKSANAENIYFRISQLDNELDFFIENQVNF